MDYTLQEVEDAIEGIYRAAYESAKPAIVRLNPDEGMLGFWWSHFDRLIAEQEA